MRALRECAGGRLAALGVQQSLPRSWPPPWVPLKRYLEPVAHGPEAGKPMARRPGSRHTRTDAVNTFRQRDIPFL